jgi:hypothetical protein
MIFGEPTDFAIEAYHEPYGAAYGGFGRMCIHVQGVCLGNIRENHCSLFHATNRFRETHANLEKLWDESFTGLSDAGIFAVLDEELYVGEGESGGWERYGRFNFLTNTGEQFDDSKTFIVCRPNGRVHILYRLRDDTRGSASCTVEPFRAVADSYVRWFDEQVRHTAPPFFPIDPFDLSESVPDTHDT